MAKDKATTGDCGAGNPEVRLKKLRLFAGFSPDEVSDVVRRLGGEVRRFAKGEVILHEGTAAKWLMPVLSGVISVYEPGANGERHLVRSVEAGELFGATLVTTRLERYPGMAVAAKGCEVMFFEMTKIRELWDDSRYKKFFENLYTIVSELAHSSWRKLSIMACKTTEAKFMMYLNCYASEVGLNDVTLPFARMEDCAAFLGVTRASLSPAIGRLEARGEIEHVSHGRFRLIRFGPSGRSESAILLPLLPKQVAKKL